MPADIIDLFHEHGLHPVKKTAKEWASPCPCCGGHDRCNIWPEEQDGRGYYWCRQCDAKGDGIQFLRDYMDMSYTDACKRVGVAPVANLKAPSLPPSRRVETFKASSAPTDNLAEVDVPTWRSRASAFVAWATDHLLNTPVQMNWLAARGIDATAVRRYSIGYNPGEKGKNCIIRQRSVWGLPPEKKEDGKDKRLWLPRGIVIPQILPAAHEGKESPNGEVHRVRIRRTDEDRVEFRPKHKFHVVPGSAMDVLWLPCTTSCHAGGGVVVVTEAELDAVALHAHGGDLVHCVASMTSNIRNLTPETFERLQNALCILVALDFDGAGDDGWPRWEATFPRARRWNVPAGKDPGEAFALGEDLRLWLLAGIPEGLRLAMRAGQLPCMTSQKEATAQGSPVPPSVFQFHAMWQNLRVTYTRTQDADGNCIGFSWDYTPDWGSRHREELHRFFRFQDRHPDIWEWLARNPESVITAGNFLNLSKGTSANG